MATAINGVTIDDIAVDAATLNIDAAAAIYKEHGCLVVRGLMVDHVEGVRSDIERVVAETIPLMATAKKTPLGWSAANGALLLPAPENFERDKQIMCLPIGYRNSAAFLHSALEPRSLDLAAAVFGPDVEMFDEGQCLVKEAVGGHPKLLHQDAAYFEHRYDGPMARLTYAVDTDLRNGALHVVPGSFKMGVLDHGDTFSHLGLDLDEWPWERALPVEGKAGDAIFFHVNCIHGSKPNQSDKPRPIFISRWRRADDFMIVGGTTTTNRAEAEKNREKAMKQTKTSNQNGLMVRGRRSTMPDSG